MWCALIRVFLWNFIWIGRKWFLWRILAALGKSFWFVVFKKDLYFCWLCIFVYIAKNSLRNKGSCVFVIVFVKNKSKRNCKKLYMYICMYVCMYVCILSSCVCFSRWQCCCFKFFFCFLFVWVYVLFLPLCVGLYLCLVCIYF